MRNLVFPFCFLILVSCFGAISDLKGTVPDMVMYSIEYDLEVLPDKEMPAAANSLEIRAFLADSEHRSLLIRVHKPDENSAGITYYPENERWIALPSQMFSEKLHSHFVRKFSNVYLSPSPVVTDYSLYGNIKHFEEIRTAQGSQARVAVIYYFSGVDSSETIGPFMREASEPFETNPKSAVNMVAAMKSACAKLSEQMIQDFESKVNGGKSKK